MDIFFIHCIQFQNIIIYLIQCFEHGRTINKCRITQYTDFRIWEILVAKCECIFYDLRKMRMRSRFSVSGKSQYIGRRTICLHIPQLLFKNRTDFFTGWKMFLCTVFGIEAAFTIDAVERTNFTVIRQ